MKSMKYRTSHLDELKWYIDVVDKDKTINAGGKIFIYSGLLRAFSENEDIIVGAIAKEVAHMIARHHAEHLLKISVRKHHYGSSTDGGCYHIVFNTS